ncbi:hypothetical protein [Gabonia massiliensis]|uniref:hypothetical protein n=1 Tax=Gabonia massiliensis TaxID=1686296 RepID=UPI0006D8298A|nr:hypothetical protein [Gabonia massiliensis]
MDEEKVTVVEAPVKSGRQMWTERLHEMYPDKEGNYDDDDVFYAALDEYDQERGKQIEDYKQSNKKLADLFLSNPEAGAFLSALMEGSDVMTAIGESFGDYFETALGDPEAKAKYDEGIRLRREREKEMEDIQARQQENAEKNAETVESFIAEKGLDEKGRKAFEDFISELVDRVFLFDLDRDTLERLWRAMNYDRDVAEARSIGEKKGRNAKIEMEKKSIVTDGTPNLSEESRGTPAPIASKVKIRKSIWD